MLNETVLTQIEPRVQAWSLQTLARVIAVVVLFFILGCLYFSQVNAVARIRDETFHLQDQAQTLERENVSLMVQVAAWTRPGNVQAKALSQGLVTLAPPTYVALPAPEAPVANGRTAPNLAAWWQQLITTVANRWPSR